MAPLGPDYVAALKQAFTGRWIDFYPGTGKASGAYMQGGAYDVHPYLLLNYNGRYTDVSALAHELGHAMHSYFSSKHQPYPTADYATFVAEVASTFNEALLIQHMLGSMTDPKVRLSLLGDYLENVKGTVFRQTQFAEFELRAHEMAQKGSRSPATVSRSSIWRSPGSITDTRPVCVWWTRTWPTSGPTSRTSTGLFTSSSTRRRSRPPRLFPKRCSRESPGAVDRYRTFISSGGSDYPVNLLRTAGVDMTTSEPLDLTMAQDEQGDGRDREAAHDAREVNGPTRVPEGQSGRGPVCKVPEVHSGTLNSLALWYLWHSWIFDYLRVKFTVKSASDSTGFPSRVAGLNVHCLTASSVA